MAELKKSPKKPRVRYKCSKTGNSGIFCGKQQIPWQTANSAVRRENLHVAEYCWPWLSHSVS